MWKLNQWYEYHMCIKRATHIHSYCIQHCMSRQAGINVTYNSLQTHTHTHTLTLYIQNHIVHGVGVYNKKNGKYDTG